ncbi:dihydroorotate dehydrogenase [Thomasclavelia cocleata]|uniref:dihydroorotate dehydrogenase n=1 Tax=Thomasclavelia cocleata TaxID=69824 RepID=UPI0025724926|nr:dihydroorotate dehydrogenase [Thomasclavelia cocleata]
MIKISTSVNIAGITFKNPVMPASGTFGSGQEYREFINLNQLGAVVTKGVSYYPWQGNPVPRIMETPSGMINAIGLQNPGIDVFLERDIPFLQKFDTKVIVNVCGNTVKDYLKVVSRLSEQKVDILEINISCPNVEHGGIAFGQEPKMVEYITKEIKKIAKQPISMKLTPNVTDITEIAKAAESGGADALSLINTITGMSIDVKKRTFSVANKTGGLSGAAIKPIALRMVYQVYKTVQIPIIGMGGISSVNDALEFIMAGATGIAIGTANFNNPTIMIEVIDGLENYMKENDIEDLKEIRGIVE